MRNEEFWLSVHSDEDPSPRVAGGALRLALLFGCSAVIFALVATPFVSSRAPQQYAYRAQALDTMTTGSIGGASAAPVREYTLRQSVLQRSPGAVCIVDQAGRTLGDC